MKIITANGMLCGKRQKNSEQKLNENCGRTRPISTHNFVLKGKAANNMPSKSNRNALRKHIKPSKSK